MNKFTSFVRTLGVLCMPMLCTGCDWIMDDYDPNSCQQVVRIEVDWSQYDDETPSGMSIILYEDGSTTPSLITTNELEYIQKRLATGTYHAAVINNSPQEFRRMTYTNLHSIHTALLSTNAITDSWYSRRSTLTEAVSEQPETFAYDDATYLAVSDSMLAAEEAHTLTRLTPVIVTQDVELVVNAQGMEYVTELRGALTGMAMGYYPYQGHPTEERTTFLTDEWTIMRGGARISNHYDVETRAGSGYTLYATMTTFGRTYGYTSFAAENVLTLQATLTDGSLYEQSFPVGNCFTRLSNRVLRITVATTFTVPSVTQRPVSGSGSSGFDATIEDWSDTEDYDFSM